MINLEGLTRDQKLELLAMMSEKEHRDLYNFKDSVFPDTGPLSREHYPKHIEFLNKGSEYRRRALIGGNRSGKTYSMGYEFESHLTGDYPNWWQGRRFDHPVDLWIISKNNKQMVDAAQRVMMGRVGQMGTGMIREKDIKQVFSKPGIPGAVERVLIKYKGSDTLFSSVSFKSCEQDIGAFMGAEIHGAWFDEEPAADILGEVQMRLLTTNGIEVHTFTPLEGFTTVVKSFLHEGKFPTKEQCREMGVFVTNVEWDEAPHMTAQQKEEFLKGIPPYLREARSKGWPTIGEGRIYDIPESDCVVSPFDIPDHWPRIYALDVGWKVTAAVFAAYDKQNDTWYIIDEYYGSQAQPEIHAAAIRRKSKWHMPGVIDPAANRTNEKDGSQLAELYVELGLNLSFANNALSAGIAKVYDRLATNRLKIFRNCQNLLQEYRLYKYDPANPGKPARLQQDHALDCMRYVINTGEYYMQAVPDIEDQHQFSYDNFSGRNEITGY